MSEDSKFEKVKKHVKKYQTVYACGVTAVVCVVGTRYIYRSGVNDLAKQIVEKMPEAATVINNHNIGNQVDLTNVGNNVGNNAGHLHKIVKRIDKFGNVDIWESLGEAAREIADQYNLKPSTMQQMISRVANGHQPDYYGDVFQFVGTGTR